MANNITPFLGSWYVNWATGGKHHKLQTGYQLLIGTGNHGASRPFLTAQDNAVCVGFAVLNKHGKRLFGTGDSTNDPMLLLFTGDALRGLGYYDRQPVRIYIALAEAQMPGGLVSYALYGSTYSGDPDQVGVWGADSNPPAIPPPSQPPPEPGKKAKKAKKGKKEKGKGKRGQKS